MNCLGPQASNQTQTVSPMGSEDSALVAAVLRKDRKATAEFVARYADDLYSYIRSRLAPRYEQVDDLVQEVFLAAWENLSRYRGTGPLQAWVMGIARHKVEDYYRARLRAPESIEDADQEPVAPASASDFHQLLEQDELRKYTWRVLGSLPELYRLALIWRYWDKDSSREMARKTGKTEKAIERLLARARAEFRERWSDGQSS
ncbi:MAG TPA: sigma-70 family RNA polymerase sigma factor [Terriglobales bacterium]|nr:sigma-70 family RNA polymerase sigma factor [Terriglobales bacterium]